MNDITQILNLLINQSGFTGADIARQINLPYNTFNKIQNGKTTNPTIENVFKIAKYFNISVDQLIGKSPLDNSYSKHLKCIPIIDLDIISIKNISSLTLENHDKWQRVELENSLQKDNLFAIRTKGMAMYPMFDESTLAIIDDSLHIKNGNVVLTFIEEIKEYLVRKINYEGKYKILKAINQDFPTIHMKNEDIVIGVVVSSYNNFTL